MPFIKSRRRKQLSKIPRPDLCLLDDIDELGWSIRETNLNPLQYTNKLDNPYITFWNQNRTKIVWSYDLGDGAREFVLANVSGGRFTHHRYFKRGQSLIKALKEL